MLGRLLKPFLPRGLYWRAALIVFLPVVTILLVLSVGFIQRHYDGVTRQMTGNFVLVAQEVLARTDTALDAAAAAQDALSLSQTFDLQVSIQAELTNVTPDASVPFYDISGRLAIRELERGLPDIVAVNLRQGEVTLWIEGAHGLVQLDFPLSRVSARNPHQLLVLVFAIGVVMSLISFIYLKNQMRPIRRLAAAAEAFGRGQTMPLRVGGATEVRAASAAFLQMRERIERHIEQRTLLLSGVSHDLRTPLTRMRLGLSMLGDDAEAQALLGDVVEMETLIDRFLEFARNEVVEPAVTTDLGALISARIAEANRSIQRVEGVSFDDGPVAELRPQVLARALDNLINNALRYGSKARVSLDMGDGCIAISVEDDGPGIDPAQYDRARRPFVRLDPARGASNGSGVGLGLAIVEDAMRSHGGKLEFDRGQTPGYSGLVARLILPIVQDG